MNDNPIFVVGYMHSGTFLLVDILRRSPLIYTPGGETKFFEFLPLIKHAYPDLTDHTIYWRYIQLLCNVIQNGLDPKLLGQPGSVATRGAEAVEIEQIMAAVGKHQSHEALLCMVFDLYTRKAGKARWLEKTPSHVYHANEIFSHIPQARVLEVVRDPRAVLASKKVRRQTVWTERYAEDKRLRKHYEKSYDPVWDSLAWKVAVQAGLQARAKYRQQWLCVKYEELVAEQERQVMRVCDFLELPYDKRMLDVQMHNSAYWGVNNASGVTSEYVEKWRNVLTPGEVRVCQLLLRDKITAAGYRIENVQGATVFMISILLECIPGLVQRLYHRYKLLGGTYFWNILGGYWRKLIKLLAAG